MELVDYFVSGWTSIKNKFIVNGIGNRSSDRLLLIFKNKIYQYKL